MLIITPYQECPEYSQDPEVRRIVSQIIDELREGYGIEANRTCKKSFLEEVIEETAKIIKEMDDPSDYKIVVNDPIRAVIIRGLLRIMGIHARVKLDEHTTREQLNYYRRLIMWLADIANQD